MTKLIKTACVFAAFTIALLSAEVPDWRHISRGFTIPDETYSDQPYVVKTADGAWLCVLTTGSGLEGQRGQHIISTRSMDQGKTWAQPSPVEPADGPESSYAVLLKVPSGRVYVFYNHNTDDIRELKGDDPPYNGGIVKRVDSFGHFVFKYSDDNGKSWSSARFEIPQRMFEIDRKNPYSGQTKFFWTVGRSFSRGSSAYVPLYKVGGFGEGFFTSSEGVLLRSDNILKERDPASIHWETLPKGDKGIRSPAGGGPISEEHSFSVLSDGSIFCVFRTIDGYSAFSYSRDGGASWEPSQYMRYADGRLMKHPRAANFAWRCENGKFVYWFHNHGGKRIADNPKRRTVAYEDRNPAWVAGGVEADSPRGKVIRWSQPEILLYDDDPFIRMSYPDLMEDGGKYFITETQKDVARVHEIDASLLQGLWSQGEEAAVPKNGLIFEWLKSAKEQPTALPELPLFVRRSTRADFGAEDLRAGFSIELTTGPTTAATLLNNRTPDGRGFALRVIDGDAIELVLNDGRTENRWSSDPGSFSPGKRHHTVAIVDGGPKIITFVTDGQLNDGGVERQFGWGRYSPNLRSLNGARDLRIGDNVEHVRLYQRALRTSESVAAFRASEMRP